jgi:hypothetical protein
MPELNDDAEWAEFFRRFAAKLQLDQYVEGLLAPISPMEQEANRILDGMPCSSTQH